MGKNVKMVLLDAKTLGNFDIKKFEALGDFVAYPSTSEGEILERCKDAEIAITNKVVFNAKTLESLPNLKLICITATGMNNIDLDAAKRLNIEVKNVAGYSTFAVAQHTLMLALAFLGELPFYTHYCASGAWAKSDIFCNLTHDIRDLCGLEWGIIGLGEIGRRVAHLAGAFGANVSYHSTSGNVQKVLPHKSLEELLKTSDIISIHAPLNDKTRNLIAKNELKMLKNKAILLKDRKSVV